ncbi:MAG TPA: glycosyltransferase [Chitinophaga sp.]
MKCIFWQNIISPHQIDFLKALSMQPGMEVTLVAEKAMSASRQKMGWSVKEHGKVVTVIQPAAEQVTALLSGEAASAYHIFSGFGHSKQLKAIFKRAVKANLQIGIMAEAYNWLGIKGRIRYLRSLWQYVLYNRHILFILAIGNTGEAQFLQAGYPAKKVLRWGYFIDPATALEAPVATPATDLFSMVYVGSLLEVKGVDILIRAIAPIKHQPFCLHIVGEGPLKPQLERLIARYELEQKVQFHAFMPNEKAQQFIRQQDLFILPSRKDGWGAVVNEALMQGVPVVCSSNCGASVLINEDNGAVYAGSDVSALTSCIAKQIAKGKLAEDKRHALRNWAQCITGTAAAAYFSELMLYVSQDAPLPVEPWKK